MKLDKIDAGIAAVVVFCIVLFLCFVISVVVLFFVGSWSIWGGVESAGDTLLEVILTLLSLVCAYWPAKKTYRWVLLYRISQEITASEITTNDANREA